MKKSVSETYNVGSFQLGATLHQELYHWKMTAKCSIQQQSPSLLPHKQYWLVACTPTLTLLAQISQ